LVHGSNLSQPALTYILIIRITRNRVGILMESNQAVVRRISSRLEGIAGNIQGDIDE
jgi:hypothetical protein